MNKIDINQLIQDCTNNSRKAQEQLFKLYYGKMLYVCLRYHSDRDTAQEVVQEGFIKVFEKINQFDPKGSFDGWIRRIMVNTAIDVIRKEKRAKLVDLEENHSNSLIEETSIDELEFEENSKLALACIQELSPGYRAVFNLYYVEDYTHKEIAEILGISEGTSKSNLAKAKQRIKEIVQLKQINA